MRRTSSFATLVFALIVGSRAVITYAIYGMSGSWQSYWLMLVAFVLAIIVSLGVKIANQWDRAVVLRLGRFRALPGPGLFLIVPIIDAIPYWIDIRVITSAFKAEKTLTKDTVPVDVDAVLFWKVVDPNAHSGEGDHGCPTHGDHLIRSMTTRAAHELDGAVGCSF